VILVGNVGADPVVRYATNGDAIANLRIATTDRYKDKQSGEWKETTEWTTCTAFGRTAEIINEYVKKGSSLYIEGSLRTREWEKDGVKRYSTEVRIQDMKMLGGRSQGDGESTQRSSAPRENSRPTGNRAPAGSRERSVSNMDDDDIPF
jgi:single-strand DNA-binding protein